MYYKCCVPGCVSSRKDAILHKFPKCEKRLQTWLDSIKCDSLRNKSVIELGQLQVCHKHFEARFVTEKSRLLSKAYPTLFLESEICSGIPEAPIEVRDPVADHNYIKIIHDDHNYCKAQKSHVQGGMTPIVPDVLPSTSKDHTCSNHAATNILDAFPSSSLSLGAVEHQIQHTPPQQQLNDLLPCSSLGHDSFENQEHRTPPHQQHTDSQSNCRSRRKTILRNIKQSTPNCKKLYKEYRKSRKLLSFTRRARKALEFSRRNFFEDEIEGMNSLAKKILLMQIRLHTKKERARRFSLEEKLISLSILKQGPKSYRFLQKIFILPSETTLRKMIAKFHIDCGINEQIFDSIKEEVSSWTEARKFCSIIFDEMALETGLTYTYNDEISGFIDLTEKKPQFADHALVFMIKGLVHKWQQPIAYYFCEGATSAITLKNILKEVVDAVVGTGLIPLALVSDQGAAFQSCLKSLQEETKRAQILENKKTDDTINLSGTNMHVIYDPPHLIKGLRNNFLTKDILFNEKRSSWNDIIDVYKTDCQYAETRLLHKLNDELVIPNKIKKMKVKNCVRVFSKTVAGALNFSSSFPQYSDGRPVSCTLRNTAEVVSFFDDLFDSMNGTILLNKRSKGKELRTAITATSKHHAFWREAITKLNNLKFIDATGRKKTVPTIQNWISTIKSMQRLWQMLRKKNIKVLRPRYINSDAIENFFGKIRAYNYRNNNPTCHNFVTTFKSLLITGFIKFHDRSFNCEKDENNPLLKIKSLFKECCENERICYSEFGESINQSYPVLRDARRERMTIQSRAYTAGWVVRKILKLYNCKDCKNNLTTTHITEIHKWINQKEYKKNNCKLTYPAEPIIRCFGMIFDETNKFLESTPHLKNITKIISNKIRDDNDFNFITCKEHRAEVIHALLTTSIKLCINNWCTVINKILKGSDIYRIQNKQNLPEMQQKAFDKFKKKWKRNK